MPDPSDLLILRREVMGLFEHIQKMRREIASIHRPGATNDRFSAMSDELDAIVESTETATNTIMEAAETLDMITSGLASTLADEEAARKLGQVPDLVGQIFEACSFQDITGQRITKVVNSLQFIESQVHKLITMWGPDQIAEENVDDAPAMPATAPTTKDDYDSFLHGPALNGQGATQAEIDAMLAGTPPPPAAS
ncbi:protein phosphatase CheZ, partial [Rhodospirillum rubrum]|uniref:protein phosphatase CheZ n=2 Tax=Rhodospirillum rubrum TaxID=1085 RepID=UPI0019056E17